MLPGGIGSVANAINNAGLVVGTTTIPSSVVGPGPSTIATIWNGATPTALSTLGGTQSAAYGVNNSGQVVGYSLTTGNVTGHAVIWNGGVLTDLNPSGAIGSTAFAINNNGQVAGWTDITGLEVATIWNGTTPTYLSGTLPGLQSWLVSINDAGVAVGNEGGVPGIGNFGVVSNGITLISLSTLLASSDAGWTIIYVYAINDAGDIVAEGMAPGADTATALLLTPCDTCVPIGGGPGSEPHCQPPSHSSPPASA